MAWRKNIVRENGSFSQHRYFLHDKFLSNDKFLQIQKRWHGERLFETVLDRKESWFLKEGKVIFFFSNDFM